MALPARKNNIESAISVFQSNFSMDVPLSIQQSATAFFKTNPSGGVKNNSVVGEIDFGSLVIALNALTQYKMEAGWLKSNGEKYQQDWETRKQLEKQQFKAPNFGSKQIRLLLTRYSENDAKGCLMYMKVQSLLKKPDLLDQLSTDRAGLIPIIVGTGVPSMLVQFQVFCLKRKSKSDFEICSASGSGFLFRKNHVMFNHIAEAILTHCNAIVAQHPHNSLALYYPPVLKAIINFKHNTKIIVKEQYVKASDLCGVQLLPNSKLNTPINIGEIEQLINSEEAIADYIGLEDLTVKYKKHLGPNGIKEIVTKRKQNVEHLVSIEEEVTKRMDRKRKTQANFKDRMLKKIKQSDVIENH